MRRFETTMIRLAIDILDAAARRAGEGPQDRAEVRLALRVLAGFMGPHDSLAALWAELTTGAGRPWCHALLRLRHVIETLEAGGWEVTPGTMACEGWAMCNRYRMTARQAELAARYGVAPIYPEDVTFPPGDLFPKRAAPVIRAIGERWQMDAMAWGWPRTLPGKKPGTKIETQVTNVRNLESPMWRAALAKPEQRCLVPVTSFSEYGDGPKGAKPLYWFDVPSRPIFSFAGIFREAADGYVFAFLTCEPNSIVAPIHPKAMPVILHQEDEARWLAGDLGDLVAPFPAQLMSVEQASDRG